MDVICSAFFTASAGGMSSTSSSSSVAIYEILKLIRGTRAVQMGLGAGLLLALFYLSRLGHLETVNWLIRNMVGYVVFALIVLFQADIRRDARALRPHALRRLLRARATAPTSRSRRSPWRPAMLAAQRIGAIIAIEREIGLRNYIEGGIPLDATVTYDLLVTIFQPGTPLHDGAVIVQGDRVAAAACFLPLTVNPVVSKDFGTRHRAAIGLTEETDARGDHRVRGDGPDLGGARGAHRASASTPTSCGRGLGTSSQRASRGRRETAGVVRLMAYYHPFGHLGLKFVSVRHRRRAVVRRRGRGDRGAEPARPARAAEHAGEPRTGGEPAARRGRARARHRRGCSASCRPRDVVAVIDLSAARPGRRLFHLTQQNVRTPFGVEVTQVSPGTISLVFERSGSRTVRVVPTVEGRAAEGYTVGAATAEPASVVVVGPESALRDVKEAITDPVSIEGARRQVRESATVGVADPRVRLQEPVNARITVDIFPTPVQRAVLNVPVRFENTGRGLSAQVRPARRDRADQGSQASS